MHGLLWSARRNIYTTYYTKNKVFWALNHLLRMKIDFVVILLWIYEFSSLQIDAFNSMENFV